MRWQLVCLTETFSIEFIRDLARAVNRLVYRFLSIDSSSSHIPPHEPKANTVAGIYVRAELAGGNAARSETVAMRRGAAQSYVISSFFLSPSSHRHAQRREVHLNNFHQGLMKWKKRRRRTLKYARPSISGVVARIPDASGNFFQRMNANSRAKPSKRPFGDLVEHQVMEVSCPDRLGAFLWTIKRIWEDERPGAIVGLPDFSLPKRISLEIPFSLRLPAELFRIISAIARDIRVSLDRSLLNVGRATSASRQARRHSRGSITTAETINHAAEKIAV